MERARRHRLSFAYDTQADVLYISVGRPQQAVGQVLDNGVILRRTLKTGSVVGLTIVDFARHFASRNARPITTPITAELQPV